MFTPELSKEFLAKLYQNEKDRLWGKYGFADSFNIDLDWKADDVIGIDQGAIVLGIENHRTGLIWRYFSKAPEVQRAMSLAGFVPGAQPIERPVRPAYVAPRYAKGFDWAKVPYIPLSEQRFLEIGESNPNEKLELSLRFAWDEEWLYFKADVKGDIHVSSRRGEGIWKDDCLEFFVDSTGQGLVWGNRKSFQLGFSPSADMKTLNTWSWFDRQDPVKKGSVQVALKPEAASYVIEGKIKWSYLGISPKKLAEIRLSPAFHDLDSDKTERKYTWFFYSKDNKFELGKIILN